MVVPKTKYSVTVTLYATVSVYADNHEEAGKKATGTVLARCNNLPNPHVHTWIEGFKEGNFVSMEIKEK